MLAFFAIWYYLIHIGDPGEGIGERWYFTAIALRDGALLLLAARVVSEVLRPELDVVRRGGTDDPAGGVLDGAPDRWALGQSTPSTCTSTSPVRRSGG